MAAQRLMRSVEDRKIAGVAAGVAQYFDLDPTLVRIAWILAAVMGGFGIGVYIILWIVLPEGDQTHGTSAVTIAEERYARGEISADELARIKSDLSS